MKGDGIWKVVFHHRDGKCKNYVRNVFALNLYRHLANSVQFKLKGRGRQTY